MPRHFPRRTPAGLARLRALAVLTALILASWCLEEARANPEITYDHCELIGSNTVIAHAAREFPVKFAAHQKNYIGEWIDIPHPPGWLCTRYSNLPVSTLDAGLRTFTFSGMPDGHFINNATDGHYSLYKPHGTNIGYIMRQRLIITPSASPAITTAWTPVNKYGSNHHGQPHPKLRLTLADRETYQVTVESQVRLLMRGTSFPQKGKALEFQTSDHRYVTLSKMGHGAKPWRSGAPKEQLLWDRPRRYSKVMVLFNQEANTCTTPASALTVMLPPAPRSAFNARGQTAGNTGFNLQLSNCAPSITSIEYKLLPSYLETSRQNISADGNHTKPGLPREISDWTKTYTDGTLPSSGTASGVGVQVLDGSGNPVKFDRTSRLTASSYTPGAATATIPLQAQYIQTGPAVTPGTVHAMMNVLYMYK